MVKWSLSLVVLSVLLWLVAAAYLFSQEDYAPKRGSLTYYIGISNVVRGVPLVAPVHEPEYFGSVGDGNKPPQSKVVYETYETNASKIWIASEGYFNQNGFEASNPMPLHATHPQYLPNERVIQQGQFTSKSGELIVVMLTQSAGESRFKIRISHFD